MQKGASGLKSNVTIQDWGRTHYQSALSQQKELVEQRISGTVGNTLIFTEHYPVYTIGRRKNAVQNLVWTSKKLAAKDIEVVHTNRGGDITYHGPGQIVGYMIVSLSKSHDLHAYLRNIEEVIIRTLNTFDLKASRRKDKTGIWISTRKICAIGIAVRTWVTYHGFALNLNPDMSHFSGIIPCGITDGTVTSMHRELGTNINSAAVKERLAVEFGNIFADISANDE